MHWFYSYICSLLLGVKDNSFHYVHIYDLNNEELVIRSSLLPWYAIKSLQESNVTQVGKPVMWKLMSALYADQQLPYLYQSVIYVHLKHFRCLV